MRGLWQFFLGCLLVPSMALAADATFSSEDLEFFETQVRPVLVEHCYKCHGPDKEQAGLRLDSRESLLRGGENGPAMTPGKSETSLLLSAIQYTGDTQMPPDGKLSDDQIAAIEHWIGRGAPWPSGESTPDAVRRERQRAHWAFQPVRSTEPPQVTESNWCRTPVDQFVLARLESEKIEHSPPADRRTLIRRLTYDLTGLPPTFEEVESFVNDPAPDAYAKLVDRLLESPHYGEQWARHWLDVARYSDTKGYVYAREERFWVHAPTYRDWVVKAFNDDLPYDRFLMLQIAADQVAPDDIASQAAMGFLTLGRRFLGVTHDIYDDRIDVISRGTMGLTVSCARCHDHKYDPIPMTDYYALYGVFMNSRESLMSVSPPVAEGDPAAALIKDLSDKQAKLAEMTAKKRNEAAERVRSRIGDYLFAQTELQKAPQEGFDIIIATTDLIPAQIWRFEAYIASEIHLGNPVFIPWGAFAKLGADEFAARSAEVFQSLGSDSQTPSNPLVLQALTPAPMSFGEVTERYARLLTEIDKQWKDQLAAATAAGSPMPTELSDPHAEALRQVLYGPASPCEVYDEAIVSTELYYDSGTVNELWALQNDVDRTLIQNPQAPAYAVVLKDRDAIRPNRILRRGNPATKTDFVTRHGLSLFAEDHPSNFTQGSGRLELAQTIVDPANPLTARVWVNRIWQHHFGAGLVRTPSDFGVRAEAPSHPELLDWLATQFIQNGWSTKAIHRLILLSNTYQQQSSGPTDPTMRQRVQQLDPENRWLWRMNVHRLAWEEYRDSLLAITRQIDLRLGGRSADLFAGQGAGNRRRTLYGTVDRQFLPSVLRMFDFANPDLHIPARSETTVPQQALFGLNHPLMAEKARALAAESATAASGDVAVRIASLFRAVYQRDPQSWEYESARLFVTQEDESVVDTPSEESKSWSYGFGEIDPVARQLKGFQPIPYFSGSAWQGGTNWPDSSLGWVQITARGGHPGNDLQHAIIRRWTAPRPGDFSIKSTVTHEVDAGDGIRCWIIASRGGVLGQIQVRNSSQDFDVPTVSLQAGDTIDFVVDIHEVLNSDQHFWSPTIREVTPSVATPGEWAAERDFTGPVQPRLDRWEQLAQVLLLSNELMFVD